MRVGSRGWDFIEIPGLQVVGPMRANGDTRDFSDMVRLVGAAWRFVFGRYNTRVDAPMRFAGTSMFVRLYSSCSEEVKPGGEAVYKTHMFGGTINEGYRDVAENDRFLNLRSIHRDLGASRLPGHSATPASSGRPRSVLG